MKYHHGSTSGGDCCYGCADRHIGCHDVQTCERWAEAVERREKERKNRLQAEKEVEIFCDSLRRRTRR